MSYKMGLMNIAIGVVSMGVLVYLFITMIWPEKF